MGVKLPEQEHHKSKPPLPGKAPFPAVRVNNYAELARRISAWTTNSLATAIVFAAGLALGWQVIAWWREKPVKVSLRDAADISAKLPSVGDEREFWTSGGLLKVQRQSGGPDEAMSAMRAFCRQSESVGQRRTMGEGEAKFVTQLLAQTPLEEAKSVALYQPPGQSAMVVAVDRDARRIVGWSFAMPAGEGAWSLYHFRPK